jgi:hypothetical protein
VAYRADKPTGLIKVGDLKKRLNSFRISAVFLWFDDGVVPKAARQGIRLERLQCSGRGH